MRLRDHTLPFQASPSSARNVVEHHNPSSYILLVETSYGHSPLKYQHHKTNQSSIAQSFREKQATIMNANHIFDDG